MLLGSNEFRLNFLVCQIKAISCQRAIDTSHKYSDAFVKRQRSVHVYNQATATLAYNTLGFSHQLRACRIRKVSGILPIVGPWPSQGRVDVNVLAENRTFN